MRVCFLPAGDKKWASARLRAWNVADHWEAADCPRPGASLALGPYGVVVFQKHYAPGIADLAKLCRAQGRMVVWDLCDPMWWWYPEEHRNFSQWVNVAVCSNENLAGDFAHHFPEIPVRTIPDTIDLRDHPTVKQHQDTPMPKLVWYGLNANRLAMEGIWTVLLALWARGLRFSVRLVDEQPTASQIQAGFPLEQMLWSLDTFHDCLLECDIALNPPFPGPWGLMKSNNKTLTAWAAGLPCVEEFYPFDTLERLILEHEFRAEMGAKGRQEVESNWTVERAVGEWQQLLKEVPTLHG